MLQRNINFEYDKKKNVLNHLEITKIQRESSYINIVK